MKKILQPVSSPCTLMGYALFGLLVLASPFLSAQTFVGQKFLAETPMSFHAIIHADAQKDAITIHLEKYSAESVHIQVLNQGQQPVYDDYVTLSGLHVRLDVSALPAGTYTVALSSRTTRYAQQVLIDWSATRRVVMVAPSTNPDSLFTTNMLLATALRHIKRLKKHQLKYSTP